MSMLILILITRLKTITHCLILYPLDNIFIFLEKDGYMPLGVLPLTNNYPPNTGKGEQVITDAILTNNGEYISVGDNFYLKYL
jgi:hypothetical protein